jgi:hypothetical protein
MVAGVDDSDAPRRHRGEQLGTSPKEAMMVRIERTATGAWEVMQFEIRIGVHRGAREKAKSAALRQARRITTGPVLVVDRR